MGRNEAQAQPVIGLRGATTGACDTFGPGPALYTIALATGLPRRISRLRDAADMPLVDEPAGLEFPHTQDVRHPGGRHEAHCPGQRLRAAGRVGRFSGVDHWPDGCRPRPEQVVPSILRRGRASQPRRTPRQGFWNTPGTQRLHLAGPNLDEGSRDRPTGWEEWPGRPSGAQPRRGPPYRPRPDASLSESCRRGAKKSTTRLGGFGTVRKAPCGAPGGSLFAASSINGDGHGRTSRAW